MQIGIVGLGRMGNNIARRLMRAGHESVVFDVRPEAVTALAAEGATGIGSVKEFASKLSAPRAIWMMLPAAIVDMAIASLVDVLEPGDVLIDGGNSFYRDDIARAQKLAERKLHYIDVGTSGGVWGLDRGFCQMIGGEPEIVRRLDPIFAALAPGIASAPPTPGRVGDPTTAAQGYLHCGPVGAGHFVKMVHNGIEYGVMAAYAEGLNVLRNANVGRNPPVEDAETAPLQDPDAYCYDLNVAEIAEVWRRGSVIASWLLDLTAAALIRDPDLSGYRGAVSDSGEGRWTIRAAIDESVPTPVLSAALYERFSSRGEAGFADKILSAMRDQFGGHHEKPPAQ
jgi:6-phosphogluconate dehydrogenase